MRALLTLSTILVSASALTAQTPGPPRTPFAGGKPPRGQIERDFREVTEKRLREELKLTDDQMQKLRAMNTRLTPRRQALMRSWGQMSDDLKQEVNRGASADQKRVSQLLDQQAALQKQLQELREEEQRDVKTFLTPVQTAQYIQFQQQLFNKVRTKLKGERPGGDRRYEIRRPGGDRRIPPPAPPASDE